MRIPFREERADWIKVLELMYENRIIIDPDVSGGFMGVNDLATFLKPAGYFYNEVDPKIDGDIDEIMHVLELKGFVESNDNTSVDLYGLTQEGLQFAHQLKSERQQFKTNLLLSIFTIILVVLTGLLVWLTYLMAI